MKKKIIKYIFLGFCILTLFAGVNQSSLTAALAQQMIDGTTDSTFVSYPGTGDGTTDTTDVSYPGVGDATTDTTFVSYPDQPYITYEGPDCWVNESWWVRDWSDGTREWIAGHGVVPGECGNPLQKPTPVACIDDVIYFDPNVGRNIHKHGGYFDPSHSLADGSGCVYAFTDAGAPFAPQPPIIINLAQQPASIVQQQQQQSQQQSQQPVIITQPNLQPPIVVQPPPQPQPPVIITPPAGGPTNVTVTTGSTTVTTGSVTTGSVSQTQTVNPTIIREVTREVIREPREVRLVEVAGVKTEVKELPKTGLPLLAWTAAAFLPAGLRLRKFSSLSGKEAETANFLWEERQFKI